MKRLGLTSAAMFLAVAAVAWMAPGRASADDGFQDVQVENAINQPSVDGSNASVQLAYHRGWGGGYYGGYRGGYGGGYYRGGYGYGGGYYRGGYGGYYGYARPYYGGYSYYGGYPYYGGGYYTSSYVPYYGGYGYGGGYCW